MSWDFVILLAAALAVAFLSIGYLDLHERVKTLERRMGPERTNCR